MVEDVERALRLQETDRRIASLEAEIAQLPKHVAAIEKQLESHRRRLEADQAALSANQKERKQRDFDIQTQQQKISKLRDQMMLAKTNDQYRAFQHEIEYCENEIRKAEDRILDLMAEAEPLDAAVKLAEAALDAERKQVDGEKAEAKKRTDEDRIALTGEQQKRKELFDALPPQLRLIYERLKKRYANGYVVADATNGSCSGCRLALRPKHFQDLRHATTVMLCENCGRILRYDPPIDSQAMYEGGTRVSMS
jgi:predicted  nucleic acid-binding Zn-ribbon protein